MKHFIRASVLTLAAAMLAAALSVGVAPATPAQAGCTILPTPPTTCSGIAAYCADGCVTCTFYGCSQTTCVNALTPALCANNLCGDDGRVNTNCSAPEIVYCKGGYAEFWKYDYKELDAFFHFKISLGDLMKSVAVKTLIKQVGAVEVWLMPDGRVLLVATQTDLKDYYMFWDPSVCVSLEEGAQWNVQ